MRRFTVVFDGTLDGKRLADFHINGATTVAYYDGDAYVCFQDFIAEIADLNAEITRLREAKDGAYEERNRVVALLASVFPSGVKKTAIPGWHAEWHGCVYVDLPTGQASWHYHDSQAHLFTHLPPYQGDWDGHTTEIKYKRVARAALAEKEEK
jgi:hypothetical protein